jgi:hypothetical protein
MGFGRVRVGQDAAGAGDELLEPGRSRSVEMAERSFEDILSFQPPILPRSAGQGRCPGDMMIDRVSPACRGCGRSV